MMDWWLGDFGDTYARVQVRPSSDGTVSVTGAGQTATAESSSAVRDGIVTLQLDGLQKGGEYPITITSGADSASGSVRTAPAVGIWDALVFSCWGKGVPFWPLRYCLPSQRPALMISEGDFSYCEEGINRYGVNVPAASLDPTLATMRGHHRVIKRIPAVRDAIRRVPLLKCPDDHEAPGNNWDGTLAAANVDNVCVNNQEELDALRLVCMEALWDYYDNPASPPVIDPMVDTGRPSFWSKRVNSVEFFSIDTTFYRDAVTAAASPAKTMLGVAQKAWFKSALLSSDAAFKIIVSPKETYPDTGFNNDGWMQYTHERNELIDFIYDNNVTGVVWIAGDSHQSNVVLDPAKKHWALKACPLGRLGQDTGVGYAPNIVWKPNGNVSMPNSYYSNFTARLKVQDDVTMRVELVDVYDRVMWVGQIDAGSRDMYYPQTAVRVR